VKKLKHVHSNSFDRCRRTFPSSELPTMSFPNSSSSFRAWTRDENDKPSVSGFALFRRRASRVAPASRAIAPRRPLGTLNPAIANTGTAAPDRLLLLANVALAMDLLERQQASE
jgi:hypothetical protein